MSNEVKESTKYESLIGVKESTDDDSSPLSQLMSEIEDTDSSEKEWKKMWVGMPEFNQKENPPFKTVYVHFRNKEDFDKFCKLYKTAVDEEQTITVKTKSMWYPHLNREDNALLRWIEDDN